MYDSRARRNLIIIYLIFFGIIALLWLLAKPNLNIIVRFPYMAANQLSGLLTVSLISLNLLLASRAKLFENLFGGLDKVYKQHQLTGKIAFAMMIAHPTFLFLGASSLSRALRFYLLDFGEVAYNYGKLALLFFTILIVLTIFIKLPYHIWRRTHQLMIIPVIFATLHVATVSGDIGEFAPLGLWTFSLLGIGIVSYVYKVILYPYIGPKIEYKIQKVNIRGIITEIILLPINKQLFFEPGQFVFAVFDPVKRGSGITSEEHPFSISSSPDQDFIRLSIKKSGDFTATMPQLKPGEMVKLYGPYGQFGKRALTSKKEVLMIAGGIGITPFLSIVNYISNKNINLDYKLIYSYKNDTDNTYKEELEALAKEKLTTHHSDRNGHLTAELIQEKTGDLKNKLILLCGPKGMMKSLTKQFIAMGVQRKNIIFEDFDLKG